MNVVIKISHNNLNNSVFKLKIQTIRLLVYFELQQLATLTSIT